MRTATIFSYIFTKCYHYCYLNMSSVCSEVILLTELVMLTSDVLAWSAHISSCGSVGSAGVKAVEAFWTKSLWTWAIDKRKKGHLLTLATLKRRTGSCGVCQSCFWCHVCLLYGCTVLFSSPFFDQAFFFCTFCHFCCLTRFCMPWRDSCTFITSFSALSSGVVVAYFSVRDQTLIALRRALSVYLQPFLFLALRESARCFQQSLCSPWSSLPLWICFMEAIWCGLQLSCPFITSAISSRKNSAAVQALPETKRLLIISTTLRKLFLCPDGLLYESYALRDNEWRASFPPDSLQSGCFDFRLGLESLKVGCFSNWSAITRCGWGGGHFGNGWMSLWEDENPTETDLQQNEYKTWLHVWMVCPNTFVASERCTFAVGERSSFTVHALSLL